MAKRPRGRESATGRTPHEPALPGAGRRSTGAAPGRPPPYPAPMPRTDPATTASADPGWYVALGDSMSIDLYPDLDATEKLGRPVRGAGAVTLFHRNDDALWPEFAGRDLSTMVPGIRVADHTSDGATTDTVLEWQVGRAASEVRETGGVVRVATLSVGGNDLLQALGGVSSLAQLERAVARLGDTFREVVQVTREAFPEALLVLTTVYDPTDATGLMPDIQGRLPIEVMQRYNDVVREVAALEGNAALADAHRHMHGHGMTEPDVRARWYWSQSIIEPSYEGASEIRRLWVEAVERLSVRR